VDDLYRVPENGKAEIVNGESKVYRSDDVAEAEPALPGWMMRVDDMLV